MASLYDITDLPIPDLIEVLDFEAERIRLETFFLTLDPEYEGLVVEGDPVKKLIEAWAYDRINWKNIVNEKARQTMLSYANGTNLDQISANTVTTRLIVEEGDPNANPPIDQIVESDSALRYRAQHAPEKFTCAGPRAAYEQLTLEVDGNILYAKAESHTPESGCVTVTLLTHDNGGVATQELLDQVHNHLTHDDVAPCCDTVYVNPAELINSTIELTVTYFRGANKTRVDAEIIKAIQLLPFGSEFIAEHSKQLKSLEEFIEKYGGRFGIGEEITRNALHDAARVAGVQNIHIAFPIDDITPNLGQAVVLGNIMIIDGGEYGQ